jgi:outer membrane protein assembly factor BamA
VYGGVRVDFRNYVFSDSFDEAAEDEPDLIVNRFAPSDNVDEDGDYKPKKYKLTFSPDLVYGTAGYDALYGVQGVTQMMFSDMLGNHQIFVATNLLIDLRNSDYILAYNYLPKRVDWGLNGYHISRLLPDYRRLTYYRYRQYGTSVTASYPLDKFRRMDFGMSVMGVSQADISDPTVEPVTRTLLYPSVTFTKDVTTPGFLYPVGGRRLAVSLSGSPGLIGGKDLQFATLLADARAYVGFARNIYSFAFRLSGGTSVGSGQQLFYSSGVQNWINRHFDDANGFPIDDITDFIFATPVLPLRGYEINAQNGSHFGLFNAEFRFPLVAAILPGPLPVIPFYNIQGTAFLDAGGIWGGKGLDRRFNVFTDNAEGDRVFDDLLVGAGVGLRTILLGYPVRIDVAWPYDGRRFGDRRTYFSVGLDF